MNNPMVYKSTKLTENQYFAPMNNTYTEEKVVNPRAEFTPNIHSFPIVISLDLDGIQFPSLCNEIRKNLKDFDQTKQVDNEKGIFNSRNRGIK